MWTTTKALLIGITILSVATTHVNCEEMQVIELFGFKPQLSVQLNFQLTYIQWKKSIKPSLLAVVVAALDKATDNGTKVSLNHVRGQIERNQFSLYAHYKNGCMSSQHLLSRLYSFSNNFV